MNKTDQAIIDKWEENIDEDDSWDEGHSLCIDIHPEFADEVRENIVDPLIEEDGSFYLDEVAPGFWIDVEDESLKEWAIEFFDCKPEWVKEVSVNG